MFPQEPKGPLMGEGGGQRCPSLDRRIPAVLAVSLEEADHEPVRRVSWQGVSEETQDLRRRPQEAGAAQLASPEPGFPVRRCYWWS